MIDTSHETYWRQLDIVHPDLLASIPVTMIGVGGLGSPTAILLAKMGVKKFKVYDHDTIEEHNVPNQMYTLKDIGRPKVEAISEVMENMGAEVKPMFTQFKDQRLRGVVIVTVDSMAGRKMVWDAVKMNDRVPLLIDARMGAEEGRVFSVNPVELDDIAAYEATLYSDEEAVELPCTAQSIIYNTFTVAAIIGRYVKGYAMMEMDLPKSVIIDSIQFGLYKLG